MKKTFIKVGFEFTAAMQKGVKLTNPSLYREGDSLGHHYNNTISKHKWIDKNFQSDECGCEIPTPVITNKADVSRYFKEFQSFVKASSLTTDFDKAVGCLGGCHIHLGIGFMPIAFRRRFLKNVAVFLTNHPQLNWGFNEPNDNVNANSLLTEYTINPSIPAYFATCNIEISCYAERKSIGVFMNSNGLYERKPSISPLDVYKDDASPYKAFMSDPLKVFLKKKFAMRYNEDFKTLELRIFDMPTNLKQHLLHYEVAMAIFNTCYEATKNKIAYNLLYHNWTGYVGETVNVALLKFDECMDRIGINPKRLDEQRENIRTRHRWTGIKSTKRSYNPNHIYLY